MKPTMNGISGVMASVLATGGQTKGDLLHLAARHQDGKWVMVYLADKADFSVPMDKLTASDVSALWVNPRTGDPTRIGRLPNKGVKAFSTPEGWEDALLILEAADSTALRSSVLRCAARAPSHPNPRDLTAWGFIHGLSLRSRGSYDSRP